MPTRRAVTTWTGGLQDGTGEVSLASSHAADFEVSFPRRAADDAEGVTSPEELIAAAHSSCLAMQFSSLLAGAGGSDIHLSVRAEVSLGPDPAGGFRIPAIAVTVRGRADGITPGDFAQLAEQAKQTCPVSKALAGTEITLMVDAPG
ncbi:MAG: OsmC family peroxiredoxin [Kineosporiaceae bacterium]|nr:OsmC family peroxiredoxin [Kineosporiaceae bacterium]